LDRGADLRGFVALLRTFAPNANDVSNFAAFAMTIILSSLLVTRAALLCLLYFTG